MKILIFGLGSIGKRHARLLRQHFPQHELFAFRTYQGQEKEMSGISVSELTSWEVVDKHKFDVAVIANPTFLHIQTAKECAKREMHLFLEKPIDCKTKGLNDLLSLVEERHLTSYVAYPLRYHAVVKELKSLLSKEKVLHSRSQCSSYLPDWRPDQDHLQSYSLQHKQGGGVLLDLSHDVDLLQYLFGEIESVDGKLGKKSQITIDSDDYADLLIKHPKGSSLVHLNYFSRQSQRFIEIDTDDAFIKADFIQGAISYKSGSQSWTKSFPFIQDDMYVEQLKHFFKHIDDPKMENNLFEASVLFRKLIELRENA